MDGNATSILDRYKIPRHRLTLDDYHRLGEAGILNEDDRVELLEGQLIDMSPIGPRHALTVETLNALLLPALSGRAWVRPQNPIALDGASEPQPDIVVVRKPWRGYPAAHPGPDDIFLLIEVAASSHAIDFGAKRDLYAQAGIREFWIIDLTTNTVQVCRGPAGGAYESVTRTGPAGTLAMAAFPDVVIPVAELFT